VTTTDSFGSYCQTGTYCGAGSSGETSCSAGTFGPGTHAFEAAHCMNCPAGKYCESTGLAAPTGDCTAGYFCLSASASPTQTRCDSDNYCPTGTVSMIPCAEGYYSAGTGAVTCNICPAGKYCTDFGGEIPCEVGYYCANDKKYPCPAGTYSELTENKLVTDCSASVCPVGYACFPVNTKVTCSGGFVCDNTSTGAFTPRPNSDAEGGRMCIPGYYCAAQSSVPTDCGRGNYCANFAA